MDLAASRSVRWLACVAWFVTADLLTSYSDALLLQSRRGVDSSHNLADVLTRVTIFVTCDLTWTCKEMTCDLTWTCKEMTCDLTWTCKEMTCYQCKSKATRATQGPHNFFK